MFLEDDRRRTKGGPHGNPGAEAEGKEFSGGVPWEHLRARAHPLSHPDGTGCSPSLACFSLPRVPRTL